MYKPSSNRSKVCENNNHTRTPNKENESKVKCVQSPSHDEVVHVVQRDSDNDFLENSFEYEDDSDCTQPSNISDTTLTAVPEEDDGIEVLENESPEDKTKRYNQPKSAFERTYVIKQCEEEDENHQESASTLVAVANGGSGDKDESPDLQQVEHREWELKSFKANFENYMDNESLYPEDDHPQAIRSALIQTGDKIGIPCTFLVHLYLSTEDDNNNFKSHNQNLSKEKESRSSLLNVEVEVRLVESVQPKVFSNFTVQLSLSESPLCEMEQPIREWSLRNAFSTHNRIEHWNQSMSKMNPSDSVFVDIRLNLYVDPRHWTLDLDPVVDVNLIRNFMETGELDLEHRKSYRNILKKCNERRLSGVIECFDRAIATVSPDVSILE